jgi:hypothetical protein
MPMLLAERVLEQAASSGFQSVWITGGEPLLFVEEVGYLIEATRSLGMHPAVQTNAYWARSLGEALDMAMALKQRGVSLVAISTDRFHLPFVPLCNVLHAVRACKQVGVPVTVSLSVLKDDSIARGIKDVLSVEEIPVGDQPVVPFGRARQIHRSRLLTSSCIPESGCWLAFVPNVFPDGTVIACCGPAHALAPGNPLILGNATRASLTDLLEGAQRSPVLAILRMGGPLALLEELRSASLGYHPCADYTGKCEVCVTSLSRPEVLQTLEKLFGSRTRQLEIAGAALIVAARVQEEIEKQLDAGLLPPHLAPFFLGR